MDTGWLSDQDAVMGLGCIVLSVGGAVTMVVLAIKGTLGDAITRFFG